MKTEVELLEIEKKVNRNRELIQKWLSNEKLPLDIISFNVKRLSDTNFRLMNQLKNSRV